MFFFNSVTQLPNHISILKSDEKLKEDKLLTIKSGSINDMPFFCAMECKVRKRTNIWVKLRAGNDESYMKMIHSSAR